MDISSKSNLSKTEQSELSKLINDKTIIIKPADKGGAVVVLSTEHYKTMIMQHLDDASTYKKLDLNIDMKIHKNLKKLLHKYNKCFTESEKKFLNEKSFETSNFYGLPKIHKSKVIETAIHSQNTEVVEVREPCDLKVRPIVGGPNCPTRRLSYFLDTLLQPYLKHVKSYIRDSVDFLNKCPREVDPDTEIVTFDVTSLYTSIPHEYGLKALGYFLTTFKEERNPRFNNQFILDAADFILKNNSLTFDSMFFLQLKGTAMGTVFAPTYANLTMAYHEIQVYFVIKNTYSLVVSKFFEENWFRFLDDCEILLNTKLIKPNDLLTILNQVNPNLQFTMERSTTNLPFLDIMINKTGTKIWMDIYNKPTDSKRYVPFTSNHPRSCLRNIPFCLARRICAIVEEEETKLKRLSELKTSLKKQKYPIALIENSIKRALQVPLNELRKSKEKGREEIIPFVSTHNPNNPNIFPIIRQTFESFQHSKTMSNVFNGKKLINSMRQAPNLERLLCKSKFMPVQEHFHVNSCGKNCVCCPYLLKAFSYLFKRVNKVFFLKNNFNCESRNLIYVVICQGCQEEYIGETGCLVKERISVYRQHIRQPQYEQIKVEEHLRFCSSGEFQMFPFLQIKQENKLLRKAYKDYFIDRFKPLLNQKV